MSEERLMKNYNGEKIFSLEYDKETLRDMVIAKQEENELLQDRIDKAIKYIEDRYHIKGTMTYDSPIYHKDLLEILKGSEQE